MKTLQNIGWALAMLITPPAWLFWIVLYMVLLMTGVVNPGLE
jgi:hypothetical protein